MWTSNDNVLLMCKMKVVMLMLEKNRRGYECQTKLMYRLQKKVYLLGVEEAAPTSTIPIRIFGASE